MSNQNSIPKGLCSQEVKRGHIKKPPIPYIPVENEIGDGVKGEPHTFKVKINEKTTVNASIWTGRNLEGFLIHVISALNYCARNKLIKKWTSAKNEKFLYKKDLQDINNYIWVLYNVKKSPPESKKTASEKTSAGTTMANKKLRREQLILPFLLDRLKSLKQMNSAGPKRIMQRS